ncbi:MAG: hypothetical protein SF162_14295 [bacterium]|nr:hypothetical protein [bacterium]
MTAGFVYIQPPKGSPTIAAIYRTRAKRRFLLALTHPNDLSKTRLHTVELKPGKEADTILPLLNTIGKEGAHFAVKIKRKTATFTSSVHPASGMIRFESKAMNFTYTPADTLPGDADSHLMLITVIALITHGDAGSKFSMKIESGTMGGFTDVLVKDQGAATTVENAAPAAKANGTPSNGTPAVNGKANGKAPASAKAAPANGKAPTEAAEKPAKKASSKKSKAAESVAETAVAVSDAAPGSAATPAKKARGKK